MLFGLAFLAGLVGYAFVDPFNTGDDSDGNSSASGLNDDAVDQSGEGTGSTDIIADALSAGADEDAEDATDSSDTDAVDNEPSNPDETTDDDVATDDDDDVATDDDTDETGTVIDGTSEDDLIYGGDGDYSLFGGGGDDQLHGGDGSTTINGDDGNDRLYAGDGFIGVSANTLNGGDGDDTIYGSNEAENTLNGGDGNDVIHLRGQDTATGGDGADAFHHSTEYGNGMQSMITDYDATEDQIIVEHAAGFISGGEMPTPEVSIMIDGNDAVICLDGDECIIVQGAANSLTVEDILLRANPVI